jgi:hypothetical protein
LTGIVERGDVKNGDLFVGTVGMDELRNRGRRLPVVAVVVVDSRSPLLLPLVVVLLPLLLRNPPATASR